MPKALAFTARLGSARVLRLMRFIPLASSSPSLLSRSPQGFLNENGLYHITPGTNNLYANPCAFIDECGTARCSLFWHAANPCSHTLPILPLHSHVHAAHASPSGLLCATPSILPSYCPAAAMRLCRRPAACAAADSWGNISSMLFIEAPAGVGFSYADFPSGLVHNDTSTAQDNLNALIYFFANFPEYAQNDLYISGAWRGCTRAA